MSDAVIKSVRRVFEILELFERERRPLAAKEIAKRLDYPLMSAHALLKSMHALGYADFDQPTWTYLPSRSIVPLVSWVHDFLDQETDLLEFVRELNATVGETINISRRIDEKVKIIHGLESLHSVGVSVRVGTIMPVTQSLTGVVSLAHLDATALESFWNKLLTADPDQVDNLDRTKITELHQQLEKCGTATATDMFVQGIGAICLPITTSVAGEELVIGIVGPSDRISARADGHKKILKNLVRKHGIKTLHKLI